MPSYVVARIHTRRTLEFVKVEAERAEIAPNQQPLILEHEVVLCDKFTTACPGVMESDLATDQWREFVLNSISGTMKQ